MVKLQPGRIETDEGARDRSKWVYWKNLIAELERSEGVEVLPFDIDTPQELLEKFCLDCDFIFNLAT